MAKNPDSFEDSLARLETIVAELEAGDLPLETSLQLFEEGIGVVKRCTRKLDEAEKRVEVLLKEADGEVTTVPLDSES
ncbi:MAG: exodeoxyribonuclease VII small subunit [Nitrospirota bacterium]|jgi:exodeoxyribonuclease VII small subunit